MNSLVSAIVLQAVKDLEKDKFRSDAKEFFNSDWFVTIADILELDARSIQDKVATETIQTQTLRAIYH